MKIKLLKSLTVLLLAVAPSIPFAQNNLPIDMKWVEGGFYGNQVHDSITNTTKTYYLGEIDSFYMSATETSVHDFEQFCKETNRNMPSPPDWGWKDPKLPVVNVTYADALKYCNWLTEKYEISFSLPTPQQWEYAARAGNFDTDDFIYNKELPNQYVIYLGSSKENPDCITCMQPNEIGLYAMCGNVWEWTLMEYKNQRELPVMGGSFFEDSDHVKVTTQKVFHIFHRQGDLGFRVVVAARDFKQYLFLEKAKMLLKNLKLDKQTLNFTKKGIFQDNLFIAWNSFETFSFDKEQRIAKFCCWVENIDSPREEVTDSISFSFETKDLIKIQELADHLNNLERDN